MLWKYTEDEIVEKLVGRIEKHTSKEIWCIRRYSQRKRIKDWLSFKIGRTTQWISTRSTSSNKTTIVKKDELITEIKGRNWSK